MKSMQLSIREQYGQKGEESQVPARVSSKGVFLTSIDDASSEG